MPPNSPKTINNSLFRLFSCKPTKFQLNLSNLDPNQSEYHANVQRLFLTILFQKVMNIEQLRSFYLVLWQDLSWIFFLCLFLAKAPTTTKPSNDPTLSPTSHPTTKSPTKNPTLSPIVTLKFYYFFFEIFAQKLKFRKCSRVEAFPKFFTCF